MLHTKPIRRLHIELSNICNSKCPLCPRLFNIISEPKLLKLSDFKLFFSKEFLSQLRSIEFCGNYGEPTLCKDILNIHEYIYSINTNVEFMTSTNGGTNTLDFWTDLGKFYNDIKHTGSYVKFCIDGLEDTNHIYRRNVDWNKLQENFNAYNLTNALSQWSFIPFKHNQHQYQIIKDNFKYWGFDMFHVRPCYKITEKNSKYLDYIVDNVVQKIQPPDDSIFTKWTKKEYPDISQDKKCVSKVRQELYIDVFGNVYPCCWYGSISPQQANPINSLFTHDISTILNNFIFKYDIEQSWNNKSSICINSCKTIPKKI